jgi:FkbM family methyltransferase
MDDLIYDVGMNNGDDTAYYLAKGFRVVAIEADPFLVQDVSPRFQQEITAGRLTILNVGVSDAEGTFPFYVCDTHREWSTFDVAAAEDKGVSFRQIDVRCRRFRSVLDEFGAPYYLKLDIEGNEIHCLKDLNPNDLPDYISFEKTGTYDLESLKLLQRFGYTGFKLISQHEFLPVEYPPSGELIHYERMRDVRENRNLIYRIVRKLGGVRLSRFANPTRYRPEWTFPLGSSGAFGEDTPGRWLTFDEMSETVARANSSFALCDKSALWGDAGYSFWADFHARRENT